MVWAKNLGIIYPHPYSCNTYPGRSTPKMIDTWLDSLTPRIVRRWAIRVLFISAPAAVIAFVLHAAGLHPAHRGDTLMMSYAGAMFVAFTSVTVAALATCHMRVAGAFTAGYRAGMVNERFEEETRPVLTVVE